MLHRVVTIVFILSLIVTPGVNGQQGGATTYVYDDDGRLIAVISASGEAGVYTYDDAGNFTSIKRLAPNDLSILAFSPGQGPVGIPVTIYGTGFNQGVNAVSFNGISANIISSNLATVVAVVPEGATTGPITVVTPRGNVTSTKSFVVRGVRVKPDVITIAALETVQFDLSISGTPTSNVIWSIRHGDAVDHPAFGIINQNGLYTAPNLVGENIAEFIVRATSVDDAELFGEAIVRIVPIGEGFRFRSDSLSVRYGIPPNTPPAFTHDGVSVRYGVPPNTPPTFAQDGVSARYGTPANNSSIYVTGAVSATRGPVLTSLTPANIARGTSTSLTLTGVVLNGATNISFFNRANGAPASGISISNITVNGAGTSLTATITIASNAITGSYVVVVATPNGPTVRVDIGSNLLQIN